MLLQLDHGNGTAGPCLTSFVRSNETYYHVQQSTLSKFIVICVNETDYSSDKNSDFRIFFKNFYYLPLVFTPHRSTT